MGHPPEVRGNPTEIPLAGHGPRLDPIDAAGILALEGKGVLDHLQPVLETVRRLRTSLPGETALLGFCGAPWTVATYMIAGHGTPDQAPARLFAYKEPKAFAHLLDTLADLSADYLVAQIDAGADGVKVGFTDNAGRAMVGSATQDGRRVFVALIRSQNPAPEAQALLEWAFKGYTWQ